MVHGVPKTTHWFQATRSITLTLASTTNCFLKRCLC
jgi:hypothetical protein